MSEQDGIGDLRVRIRDIGCGAKPDLKMGFFDFLKNKNMQVIRDVGSFTCRISRVLMV